MVKKILLVLVILLVAAQFVRPLPANVPIDPAKTLVAPPPIQSMFDRACQDCHTNQTRWPWYAQIAPVSWWLADHVKDGRREVNFSEWQTYSHKRKLRKLQEICEQVNKKEMPPTSYLPLHADAKLSDADRNAICDWANGERARMGRTP